MNKMIFMCGWCLLFIFAASVLLGEESLAKLKINIQKRKNVQLEAEGLPSHEGDYFDYAQSINPEDQKETTELILESLRIGDDSNLAFALCAETLLLYQYSTDLEKIGKDTVLETILGVYGSQGKKGFNDLRHYLKELQKTAPDIIEKTKEINPDHLQSLIDRFYADVRVGEFYLGPQLREILRAELRIFADLTQKEVRYHHELISLHKDIDESLHKGVHDMYLALLFGKALISAKGIDARGFPSILFKNLSPESATRLKKLKWKVDKDGRHAVSVP